MIDFEKWSNSIDELEAKSIELPKYDVKKLKEKGKNAPIWLHFGGGNLYRGFHAEIAQKLANKNEMDSGIVVCETFDEQVVEKVYKPYNNDILEIVMHEGGKLDKRILSATADAVYCNPINKTGFEQIKKYFRNKELQFTTFTITEKGYGLKNTFGSYLPIVEEDIKNGPEHAKHTMSIVTSLLLERFLAGELPIAMVSTDNFSQNGQRFQDSILEIAEQWKNRNFVSESFLRYLKNTNKVTFPWSMIDRITPNPSQVVYEKLKKDGINNIDIVHTDKKTNIAPFTNTEAVHYLVIEDSFPSGRPNLESVGVMLTDRETVDKADVMKVTTCLNPLHTALAVFGSVMGYESIAAEMKNKDLVSLIKEIGYNEGLPVVENPEIINPKVFIDEVINKRLPNTNIPDTPQRIASDTSQKMPIRYGETIKKYLLSPDRSTNDLHFIPLVIAGWLRYLLAINDKGEIFETSPDPLLEELQQQLQEIKLGESNEEKIHEKVKPILSNESIFGVDLYEANLGITVEHLFKEMIQGADAISKTIHETLNEFGE